MGINTPGGCVGACTGGCDGENPGVLIRLATFRKAAGNVKQVDVY